MGRAEASRVRAPRPSAGRLGQGCAVRTGTVRPSLGPPSPPWRSETRASPAIRRMRKLRLIQACPKALRGSSVQAWALLWLLDPRTLVSAPPPLERLSLVGDQNCGPAGMGPGTVWGAWAGALLGGVAAP